MSDPYGSHIKQKTLFATALLGLLLVFAAVPFSASALVVSDRLPSGPYCGGYALQAVHGNITPSPTESTFDIDAIAFGVHYQCLGERYEYNAETRQARVPGATDPNDCLGSLLAKNNIPLSVSYDPIDDVISLDFGFTVVRMTPCSKKRNTGGWM